MIQVEPITTEPREFCWWRFLLKAVAFATIAAVGLVVFAVALIIALLLRCRFGLGYWWMVLMPRGGQKPMHQVQRFHVLLQNGSEQPVISKGKWLRGSVQPGHRVQLRGRLRGGVVWLSRGHNLTTASEFGPQGW